MPPPQRVLTRRACLSLVTGAGVLAAGSLAAGGLAGCRLLPLDGADPVAPLPADRLVFGVSGGWSGFSPPVFAALQATSMLVYGSGTVLRSEGRSPLRAVRGAVACGELTGDAAAGAYAAALANSEQRWQVDGTVRVLAVNPLPVEIDC